jgi:hypothetical protein
MLVRFVLAPTYVQGDAASLGGGGLEEWLLGHGAFIFQGMKTLKTLVEWFSADRRRDYIFALSMLAAIGAMVAGIAIYRACLGEPLLPP